ncbi:hypothetical protein, partial [Thiorhodococcus mannitoliphagus]|uniref:hypothetical protein n=1 Tax=Thiorhodococcus mannitoliphagus TaxID=329406 RepID=UPI001980808F
MPCPHLRPVRLRMRGRSDAAWALIPVWLIGSTWASRLRGVRPLNDVSATAFGAELINALPELSP